MGLGVPFKKAGNAVAGAAAIVQHAIAKRGTIHLGNGFKCFRVVLRQTLTFESSLRCCKGHAEKIQKTMHGSHPITVSQSQSNNSESSSGKAEADVTSGPMNEAAVVLGQAAAAADEAASEPEGIPYRHDHNSSQLAYIISTGQHPNALSWPPNKFVSAANMPRLKKKSKAERARLFQQSEVFRALQRAILTAAAAAGHPEQYDSLDDHPNIPLSDIGKGVRRAAPVISWLLLVVPSTHPP